MLSDKCRNFRTKAGGSYAVKDQAYIVRGTCEMGCSSEEYVGMRIFGSCTVNLENVRLNERPISNVHEAITIVKMMVRGEVMHPDRLQKQKDRREKDEQDHAVKEQQRRAELKRRLPDKDDTNTRRKRLESPKQPPKGRMARSISRCTQSPGKLQLLPRDSPTARRPRSDSSSYSKARLRAKRGRSAKEKREDRRDARKGDAESQTKSQQRQKNLLTHEDKLEEKKERAARLKERYERAEKEVEERTKYLAEKERKKKLEEERKQREKEQKMKLEEERQRKAEADAKSAASTQAASAPATPMVATKSQGSASFVAVKKEVDVPDVEELGAINWDAMQERECNQMRTACMLIDNQKQLIRRLASSSSGGAPPPPQQPTSGQHQ